MRIKPLGLVKMSSLATATGLTSVPTYANVALISVEVAPVRFRDGGIDPDATTGQLLNVGDVLTYDGDLSAIKLIQTSAGAILQVSYYMADGKSAR